MNSNSAMKAVRYESYGGPDVLHVVDVAVPQVTSGMVLIKVFATSINPFDWKLRSGQFKDVMQLTLPITIGGDVAGEVVSVGEDVSSVAVGDIVFGQASAVGGGSGACAEFALTRATQIAKVISQLPFETLAAAPLIGVSALQALEEHANIKSGERILIQGGAGAIGAVAIQLAKTYGAYVVATATGDGLDLARSCGADEVIDYVKLDYLDSITDVDVLFDTVGGETLNTSLTVMKSGGRIVSMVGGVEDAEIQKLELSYVHQNTKVTTKRLERLAECMISGKMNIQVDKVMKFDQAVEAFELKENQIIRGKIVLVP